MAELTPEQLEEILKRAVNNALDSRDRIDHETHKADHVWVETQRAREKKWNDMVEKAKLSMIGAITVVIVGACIKFLVFIGALVVAAASAANTPPPSSGG